LDLLRSARVVILGADEINTRLKADFGVVRGGRKGKRELKSRR
jgi:hypothetical protein